MARVIEDFLNSSILNDFSCIHNCYLIRNTCYHTKVVSDKDCCEMVLVLQRFQQINNLCLDGYIQGSRWLITDQNIRSAGKGNRNNDTLTHSSRILEWVFIKTSICVWNPNLIHVVNGQFFRFFSCFSLVFYNNFCNLTTNCFNWVQTSHWILEDSRNLSTTNLFPILVRR